MFKSRTMAIAGTIGALSLAAAPIAAAATPGVHSGVKPGPDVVHRVDKTSPDKNNERADKTSPDKNRSRDSTNSRNTTSSRDATNHR